MIMKAPDRPLTRSGSIVLDEVSFNVRLLEFPLMIHFSEVTSIIFKEFRLNGDNLWESSGRCEMHGSILAILPGSFANSPHNCCFSWLRPRIPSVPWKCIPSGMRSLLGRLSLGPDVVLWSG